MNSPKTFAVLGRGIAGLTAAYHLHKSGYSPTIFGRSEGQASRAAQGILSNKGLVFFESPLFKAKLESLRSMQVFLDELERESGRIIPRVFEGVYEPYWNETDFQATVSRVYRHKFWGCHQTADQGPGRDFPETSRNALGELYFPADGWFDPLSVLDALEGYLRDRGVPFIEEHVSRLYLGANEEPFLQTKESMTSYSFDRIIMATGAGTKELWAAAGLKEQKMFFVGGQTLAVARKGDERSKILVKGTRSLTLLPKQAILGSSSWKDFESDDLKADAHKILTETEQFFGLKFGEDFESRVGVRFRFKDRMPLVGWVSSGPLAQKLYLLTGFYKNGMHLAETCAREMILDVADRGSERRYPEFSPLRFSV